MKNVALIKIFLAFPNDVREEAILLDAVADELNRSIGESLRFRIEIIQGARDSHPGIGVDAQAVINEQHGEDFEIIIGTFWSRAGTPTPRADSGSIEEIEAAITRNKASPNRLPEILVYFKTAAVERKDINPVQILKLDEFRNRLNNDGVLYKEFGDSSAYESLVRVDLSKVVTKIVSSEYEGKSLNIEQKEKSSLELAVKAEDDELGVLDYFDTYQRDMERIADLTNSHTQLIIEMGGRTEERTAESKKLDGDSAGFRRLLRRTADDWNYMAEQTDRRLSEIIQLNDQAFSALSHGISLSSGDTQESKTVLAGSLRHLIETLNDSKQSTKAYKDTIAAFPRLTSEINRSKRRLVDALERWEGHYDGVRNLIEEILPSLDSPDT